MTLRTHTVDWSIKVDGSCPHSHRFWPLEARAEMGRAMQIALDDCLVRWPGFKIVDDISYCRQVAPKEWRLFRRITIAEPTSRAA